MAVIEQLVLGAIQGITEWLPISSDSMIVLAMTNIFNSTASLEYLLKYSLFLHLGTFLAALIYLRKDVIHLTKSFFNYRHSNVETKKTINFLVLSTIISGVIGFAIFNLLFNISVGYTGRTITLITGLLLLVTGVVQLMKHKGGLKSAKDLSIFDSGILGIVQGLSVLPGLSRSGLTIGLFLIRKFDDKIALRLSFLMSLPVVLGSNIVLNWKNFVFNQETIIGLAVSFLFGMLTIHILIKLVQKINFGYFTILFAVLTFIAAFLNF